MAHTPVVRDHKDGIFRLDRDKPLGLPASPMDTTGGRLFRASRPGCLQIVEFVRSWLNGSSCKPTVPRPYREKPIWQR